MKQAIFTVVDYGIDGRSYKIIVYASTDEGERDSFLDNSPHKNRFIKEDIVEDLDSIAIKVWDSLDGLEKLALERTDCVLWKESPQSKYSV
jgi:hypothetical protein